MISLEPLSIVHKIYSVIFIVDYSNIYPPPKAPLVISFRSRTVTIYASRPVGIDWLARRSDCECYLFKTVKSNQISTQSSFGLG